MTADRTEKIGEALGQVIVYFVSLVALVACVMGVATFGWMFLLVGWVGIAILTLAVRVLWAIIGVVVALVN